MNSKTTSRQERRKKSKKKSKISVWIERLVVLYGIVIVSAILGVALFVGVYIKPIYDDLNQKGQQKISSIHEGTFKDKTETVIYDNQGHVIREIGLHDYVYIPYEKIPQTVIDAVVAIEDERFYQHKGYDLEAIARAGVELIKNKGEIKQGGSTITQQLVKLQFLTLEKSYKRKVEEILIAKELEKIYSKEQILEFYLNNINYGNGAYGIETASITYFSKPSKDLTLSEIAFLTAIPNNPSLYNPVRYMDRTLKRRDIILKKMLELGYINKSSYQEAKQANIVLKMTKREVEPENYVVSFALSSATKILMEQEGFKFQYWFDSEKEREAYWKAFNETFTEVNQRIRKGGYRIYTTIDINKQQMLQESLNKKMSRLTVKDAKTGLYKTQASAVTIDNQTGHVVAIVGGRTQEDVANTFNRAFLSYRQPGSIIKPIIVYTPAFEKGMIASTKVVDKKIEYGPKNAGDRYRGTMEVREAVERSINTVPFQIAQEYQPKTLLAYLEKMEFANLSPRDDHAGIAIGGFTYGTNTLEMASAYATIARNGSYIKPTGIQKIVDLSNTVLYENKSTPKQVYNSGSAYLMTDVLKGVLTAPHATGRGYAISNMPSAGKTGTTNDNKDAWFAGYTPYYTTVVWVGNDQPKPLKDTKYAKEIWKDYMERLHKGLERKEFEMPTDISYMYVNPNNGKVSKTDNHGWWKKELVPEIYYNIQKKKEEDEYIRELERKRKAEEERLKEEKRLAEKRQAELIRYGITELEEEVREQEARYQVALLQARHLGSLYEYESLKAIMEDVKKTIEQVALSDVRNQLLYQYEQEAERIEEEKREIERRTQEEQRIKEEQQKAEKERKEQDEQESSIPSASIPSYPLHPSSSVPSP